MNEVIKIMNILFLLLLLLLGCADANMSDKEILDKIDAQTQILQDNLVSIKTDLDARLTVIETLLANFEIGMSSTTKERIDNTWGRLIVTQSYIEHLMSSFYTVKYGTAAAAEYEASGYKNLWEIFNMPAEEEK